MKPTKLTIDRTRWLRGEGSNESRLLRESDQKMCCLGFYALQCGYSPEAICNSSTPGHIVSAGVPKEFDWLFEDEVEHSGECMSAMEANDDQEISENEREFEIKAIFANNGIEVEFIN